jgi:beta-mannanase
MQKNNLWLIFTVFLTVAVFSGCGQSPEAINSANTNSVNRPTNTTANVSNTTVNVVNSTPSANSNTVSNAVPSGSNSAPATKSNQPPAKMPTPNVGSGGNDFSILMSARNAISAEKDLVNSVIIEVKDGNLTLNGKVANEEQKKKAENLMRGVQGIKSVKNNLRVGA